MKERFTKKFEMHKTKNGYRFSFYCDQCDFCVTTDEITGPTEVYAIKEAEKFGKHYFNMCHSCGAWVCETHYNIDEMKCVRCFPKHN